MIDACPIQVVRRTVMDSGFIVVDEHQDAMARGCPLSDIRLTVRMSANEIEEWLDRNVDKLTAQIDTADLEMLRRQLLHLVTLQWENQKVNEMVCQLRGNEKNGYWIELRTYRYAETGIYATLDS